MNFIKVNNYDELSTKAAALICAQVVMKPNCVLGLATGSSPLGTYEKIAEKCAKGEVDFSKVSSINLDEYVGLDGSNDQSYRYFMNTNLFEKINIDVTKTNVPNGCAADLQKECEAYDALIAQSGGIDLQLLGIGLDGHIGFNEPDSYFEKATHVVDLDPSTIEANARFFASEADVPRQAYTMGIGNIMQAKKIVVVVSGKDKAKILREVVCGPITPRVPASVLQLHPDVTIVADEAALSVLDAE